MPLSELSGPAAGSSPTDRRVDAMNIHWKRKLAIVTAAGVLAVTGGATAQAPAPADGPYIVSIAAGTFYGYATPVMLVDPAGTLNYANFDIVQHDVVQDVAVDGVANKKKNKWCADFKKGKCPLFWSARAGLGDTVPVKGLRNLKSGQIYSFYCTLHPGMKGKLVVR